MLKSTTHEWKVIHGVVNQTENSAVAQLCPACGLCCNGVLFGDVELQPEDDVKNLAARGLSLFRKGRKQCFQQPCTCFDGRLCGIYADRPNRCRSFECALLKRVQSGKTTVSSALKTGGETRHQTEVLTKLVRELGQTDETATLNRRYAAVIAEPIDLAVDNQRIERRGELTLAVDKLVRLLEAHFLA